MNLLPQKTVLIFAFTALFLASCATEDEVVYELEDQEKLGLNIKGDITVATHFYDNQGPHKHNYLTQRITGFTETFETASKGSYAAGTIDNTSSGSWYLSDALIGTLSNDRKFGSKSVRIRNTGYALMEFNMDNGASTIRIRHAAYGSNGPSEWRLIASYDDGATWYHVGSTVTTNSTTLNTVTFDVNDTERVRYGIQKTSGGSNRINIDNVEINTTSIPDPNNPAMDSNLTFGNPSDAGTDMNNYFLSKPDFDLSYNNSRGTANWVSWHLSSAWTGTTPRCNCFKSDTTLPSSFFRAVKSDYTNSGFDRGHLCPSADRNGSEESNENTYYMTNIAPQAPNNNRLSWANFESYLRSLTLEGFEVHIVSGVAGTGGTGSNGFADTMANGDISIPDSFWKVAIVLPNGIDDISRVTTTTRVIAINVPNDQGISNDWTQFTTSVDSIESLTGYDFFENIPNSVEAVVEAVVDNGPSS